MKVQADVPTQYAVRVEKAARNVAEQEGKAAVGLIEDAADVARRPVGPEGQGSIVNTTA